MSKIEKKIKVFLSDENKVKALAGDEAFIKKVSEGTATPEIYAKEFKKFGLDLNKDEAKGVSETAMKLISTPVEKLGDIPLENVTGGKVAFEQILAEKRAAEFMVPVGALGGLACSIAGFVCQNKASKYMQQGDKAKSEKYSKAAKGLGIASISCAGLATAGAACMWASKLHLRQHCKNAIL